MSTWQPFQDGCVREPKWFRRDQNYFIAAGIAGFKAKKDRQKAKQLRQPSRYR